MRGKARGKASVLIPLEVSILEAALELRRAGQAEAHGYLLAKRVQDVREAERLVAYGTLYKALDRLQRVGYLASRREDPLLAAADGRPRRRFYRLTLEGEGALSEARAAWKPASRRPAAAISR